MRLDPVWLIARREAVLLMRHNGVRAALALPLATAGLPAIFLSLRSGKLGLSGFPEASPVVLIVTAMILPLASLLLGAQFLASEIEDRTLVPVLVLPISRAKLYAGKWLAGAALLATSWGTAFLLAGVSIGLATGSEGWREYVSVAALSLVLGTACFSIGLAVGACEGGRLTAFTRVLALWFVLLFVIDALLLSLILASAPAPPEEVGVHGHSELADLHKDLPIHNAGADDRGEEDAGEQHWAGWLMVVSPIDLYRLSVAATVTPDSALRQMLPHLPAGEIILPALWLAWISLPTAAGVRKFKKRVL